MAATPKHRRSVSKRNSTRGANRYDKSLTKSKRIKKNGGKFLAKSKITSKFAPAHRISPENPEYKGLKLTKSK